MTRGGVYNEILPEPEGGAQKISRGLRPYFTVYPDLSLDTDTVRMPQSDYYIYLICNYIINKFAEIKGSKYHF